MNKLIGIVIILFLFSLFFIGLHEVLHVMINNGFNVDSKIYILGECNKDTKIQNWALACVIPNSTQINYLNEPEKLSLNDLQGTNEIVGYSLFFIGFFIVAILLFSELK